MTKFKTTDRLLDDAALEIAAGGMIKQQTMPTIPPTTGPTFPTFPAGPFDPHPLPYPVRH